VPALAEDRERLWAQLSAAEFLDRHEKRALVGLPAKETDNERDEMLAGLLAQAAKKAASW
jgi:phage portal protein BeeE